MLRYRALSPFLALSTLLLLAVCAVSPAWAADDAPGTKGPGKKKIAFMAGAKSHGYGSHEHYAGCVLLAKAIQNNVPGVETVVYRDGWPEDPKAFDDADCIVMYCDGGGRHPVNDHLEQVDRLAKRGVGVVCIHYGVEVPKGPSGEKFLDWIGGYFEPFWSVNPHWTAEFDKFPEHPITRGVEPFSINDEWYYHMRFRDGMKGVTPILTDLPSDSTLSRPDGAHSGNPDVRKAIANKEPQHVAWAMEREDGGRGFGFTGGHFHWNWGDPNFRKLVLNAILWTAKAEVPQGGVEDKPVTIEQLEENQDYEQPQNFNPEEIKKRLNLQGATSAGEKTKAPVAGAAKPVFTSPIVTPKTPGHAVEIDADITGASELYLVVRDGGDGFSCDWADWAEPCLIGPEGEKKLTELKWKSAQTDFGQVRVDKNVGGRELRIGGESVAYGIGTHANSIIAFDLPKGYTRFKARGGLDNGGADQGSCGSNSSVQFSVFTGKPAMFVAQHGGGASAASRDPADAVDGLDVADGLQATLFSSEPNLLSVTNLDVDHRGRVWVCEVVNYRKHNGERPEGDRILILEDKDGDGKADDTKVYYQGRDVDSAMGICVLGNKVIVSATPNVIVFTDTDGDDKPDKKELLFTKTGQVQHDHSAHSFLFGPDGKLYWNFGNTGKAVFDKDGKPVVDIHGAEVVDNGKPYYGGMPFRCNLDGGQFEVLAHNFRNNYEVTVDSFGNLWQSDNDDDGNRAVRINFVMEHGNYGYRDEMTGAGWKDSRTGMHEEIPLRHWHLNDPGVVPNLLQTGAGSPTGICFYEGDLLPKVFQNQIIHSDAGPNVVRAYPAQKDGAGYSAESVNILHGARDNWFRPADVCVAPDGSLLITDWYDPGVGGHNMQDMQRGRIFRVAPPNTKYMAPKFDFSTVDGALAALRNPNLATRYLAWTALHAVGDKAEPALQKEFTTADNPYHQARALWLLGKIGGRGEHYVSEAIQSDNPDLRNVGIRLARQLDLDVIPIIEKLAHDTSPQVRRECCIALRHNDSPQAPALWTELALQHDGKDRWYLEALGIAADKQWDTFFNAWLAKVGDDWKSPAGRDIVWRSRAEAALPLLAELILDSSTVAKDRLRYFRAFDFHPASSAKQQALLALAAAEHPDPAEIAALALKHLGSVDLSKSPELRKVIDRALESAAGTVQFVSLIDQFKVQGREAELLALAQQHSDDEVGVEAIRLLLARGERQQIAEAVRGQDLEKSLATVRVLGNSADGRIAGFLLPLVKDDKFDLELRRQATRAAATTRNGAQQLIDLAKAGQLDERLKASASFQLNAAPWDEIRGVAAKLFPAPPGKNDKPLPPIADLVKMKGSVASGQNVFVKVAECAKCHIVNKQGKEVGPDLSEIGGKLSRQAMLESILFPSAGISHNYETYIVALDSGNVVTGVLLSETADNVTLKGADAIARTFKKSEIEQMQKTNISIMPADLQKTMTAQELVDVVEYLTTLKKAVAAGGE
ncbi:MAG: NPCBM/NEW2 domain-containing protein [Pirellulaceae bacterium]